MAVQPDEVPALERDAFYCPGCGAFARQEWVRLIRGTLDSGLSRDGFGLPTDPNLRAAVGLPPTQDDSWMQARCDRCRRWSTWRHDRMMFPAGGTAPAPHADMPGAVVSLYEEAREVVGVSRRAGAAMARSTLEVLLREVLPDAPERTSLAGLIDLVDEKVSTGLGELLTYIRVVGNSAVHVDDVPDGATVLVLDESTTEAVDAIFAALNEVVDELITKPKQTARFAGLIPADKMAEFQRKRTARRSPEPGRP